jgi:hypothetical protein
MSHFAPNEWLRSSRALDSARQLVESDPDSAASRAYYAAFHALTAWFAVRGQTFDKHTAIRAALHRDLVKAGLLSQGTAEDYDFLLDLREAGDYGGESLVSVSSARLALEKAAAFVAAISRACPELSGEHS